MQKHLTVILSVIAILTLAACGQAQIKAPQTSHNKNAKVASTSHPKSASHSVSPKVIQQHHKHRQSKLA